MTELINAIQANNNGADNIIQIQHLIFATNNINEQDEDGSTTLHYAMSKPNIANNLEIIQMLLANGADVNIGDNDGNFPIHQVTDTETLQLLIDNGADINQKNENEFTLLHLSVIDGDEPFFIRALLNADADVNAINGIGETPLHASKEYQITRMLVATGADVNAVNNEGEGVLQTQLDRLSELNANNFLLENTAFLLASGMDPILANNAIENLPADDREAIQRERETIQLVNAHARELENQLTQLTQIPNDVRQLSPEQKNLVLKLTAPKKAGNVLLARQELEGKNLINYLGENKPNLLLFAEGYHKEKIFGGVNPQRTEIASLIRVFTLLHPYSNEISNRMHHTNRVLNILSDPNQHMAKQSGIALKRTHDAASTIQRAFRNHRAQLAQRPNNNPRPQQRRRLW